MAVVDKSRDPRVTKAQTGSRGTPGALLVQPPAKAGSPTAVCTEPHLGRFGVSPEKETPQCLWAVCSSALSPSKYRGFSSHSEELPVFSLCPLPLLSVAGML